MNQRCPLGGRTLTFPPQPVCFFRYILFGCRADKKTYKTRYMPDFPDTFYVKVQPLSSDFVHTLPSPIAFRSRRSTARPSQQSQSQAPHTNSAWLPTPLEPWKRIEQCAQMYNHYQHWHHALVYLLANPTGSEGTRTTARQRFLKHPHPSCHFQGIRDCRGQAPLDHCHTPDRILARQVNQGGAGEEGARRRGVAPGFKNYPSNPQNAEGGHGYSGKCGNAQVSDRELVNKAVSHPFPSYHAFSL